VRQYFSGMAIMTLLLEARGVVKHFGGVRCA